LESNIISSPVVVGKTRRACKFGNLNNGSTVAKIMIVPLLVGFNLYDLPVVFVEDTTASIQCVFQKVVKIDLIGAKSTTWAALVRTFLSLLLLLKSSYGRGSKNHTVTQTGTSTPNRGPCLDCGRLSSMVSLILFFTLDPG